VSNQISVVAEFERALEEILTRVCVSGEASQSDANPHAISVQRIAVAYSGGLDSAVLLHLMQRYASAHGINVFAFHIHHGISPNADAWLTHCRKQSAQLDVVFDSRMVQLGRTGKSGIEEAARLSRYAALGDLCRTHRVPLLLTAHHQDDQAETLLLQLMRGCGVAGLSGMDRVNTAEDLLGDGALLMARPLLGLTRAELENFAHSQAIAYVRDESNEDPRYARNALRHQVMPVLTSFFPGFQERVARTASHMQSAQALLNKLAREDMNRCADGKCLDVERLKALPQDRIDNLLRYWLHVRGIRMPSTAWLSEMRTQVLAAKADAQLCISHPDCDIRRHRDRVYVTPKWMARTTSPAPVAFAWRGETQISFPEYHGILHFEPGVQGFDPSWLRAQPLQLRYRQGGERLKPAANRSTRSLKNHYQALDVPAWERPFLPLVLASGELLYAAGIGMDCLHFGREYAEKIALRWTHDNPLK
jgi:tRNA(Ile)-lysidine synthase